MSFFTIALRSLIDVTGCPPGVEAARATIFDLLDGLIVDAADLPQMGRPSTAHLLHCCDGGGDQFADVLGQAVQFVRRVFFPRSRSSVSIRQPRLFHNQFDRVAEQLHLTVCFEHEQ
jgi:hypothetical protein